MNLDFLVTCVGAYGDSGVGTGGFVYVHNKNVFVIDKLDSTGLCLFEDRIYRFIRQMQALVEYDSYGIKSFIKLRGTKDVHDVLVTKKRIICVSSGENKINWFNRKGDIVANWSPGGVGDAWHLNCLYVKRRKLYVSAFGEFDKHREWVSGVNKKGFIICVNNGKKIVSNLSGPHSPRLVKKDWIVCESHIGLLSIFNRNVLKKSIQLDGFTRGLAYNEEYVFVGVSANRKESKICDYSYIVQIRIKDLKIVRKIKIPFPEIYEIILIPKKLSIKIYSNPELFSFNLKNKRIVELERQVDLGLKEVETLRNLVLKAN